jgi:hypothetical protein
MPAVELKEALKNVAATIVKYVDDAATMTVETRCVEIGAAPEKAKLAARTIVRLDGDSEAIVPMKKGPDGELVVDSAVYEMHQRNVEAATAYRAAILERLVALLRGQ